MMARYWLSIIVFLLAWGSAASATPDLQIEGTLYQLGSNRQKKLYTWKMTTCANVWTSRYYRLDGTLAVEDRTLFAGHSLAEYSYVRHTIGESASVKVRGEQLEFKYSRADQRRSETLTTSGVFLTGPAVFAFIEQHLGQLLAGKALAFKFGVLDRLDYFTFELSGKRGSSDNGSRIQIRATSPFVRMAIDPIYVTLSKEGRFRGISGRSIVMEKLGGKFVPIDADLVVESEAPAACAPSPAQAPPLNGAATSGATR
jgi:hypothetical protein